MTCSASMTSTHTPKANVGLFLIRPSEEVFRLAMQRITYPYKCRVGSQEMLKAYFRQNFGPGVIAVDYKTLNDLNADLEALDSTLGHSRLQKPPPKQGPAWKEAVT